MAEGHGGNRKVTARNISAIARLSAPKAIEKLQALMADPDPRVALDACKHILDRAIGKPIAMTADVTDRLDEFTDDELDAAISDIRNRLAALGQVRSEESPTGVTH